MYARRATHSMARTKTDKLFTKVEIMSVDVELFKTRAEVF
jgi:hypothetical protein